MREVTQHVTQAELGKRANVSRAWVVELDQGHPMIEGGDRSERSGRPAYRPVARISYPTRAFQASCHPCSVRANRATGGPGAALSQMPKYSFE